MIKLRVYNLYMTYHAQGDSLDTQFNRIRRLLSEMLSLSIFTYKQCSKL